MVVVPAIAMFSHRVRLPDGIGDAFRSLVARTPRVGGSAGAPAPAPGATSGQSQADVTAVRSRLGEIGATAIDCRRVPGSRSMHVASCRIAVDAQGELERVFHATAPNADAALRDLLDDVETWRDRVAERPEQPGAAATF